MQAAYCFDEIVGNYVNTSTGQSADNEFSRVESETSVKKNGKIIMATSDSDDFESADEEFVANDGASRNTNVNQWKNSCSAIDSESDDDNECMPTVNSLSGNRSVQTSGVERRHRTPVDNPKITQRDESPKSEKATKDEAKAKAYDAAPSQDNVQKIEGTHECLSLVKACTAKSKELSLDAELKEAEADATKSKEKVKIIFGIVKNFFEH